MESYDLTVLFRLNSALLGFEAVSIFTVYAELSTTPTLIWGLIAFACSIPALVGSLAVTMTPVTNRTIVAVVVLTLVGWAGAALWLIAILAAVSVWASGVFAIAGAVCLFICSWVGNGQPRQT